MGTQAPLRLSALAARLLRRPPLLRELVTLVGYADDYAWFAGLVRRLFPEEAEAVLMAPDTRERVARFAALFAARHYPLYMPHLEFWLEDGDEPPWSWLRRGIPYELMGIGYEGLHEMWECYRDGFSALALLAAPTDALFIDPDGLRVAWLEAAAAHIPRETLERIPPGGVPLDDLASAAEGTGFEAAAEAARWVWGRNGHLLPRRLLRRRDVRRLRRPLGGRPHRGGDGGVAAGGSPHGRRVVSWPTGWRRTCPRASPGCWTPSSPGSLNHEDKEESDRDHGNGDRPVVPAGHR